MKPRDSASLYAKSIPDFYRSSSFAWFVIFPSVGFSADIFVSPQGESAYQWKTLPTYVDDGNTVHILTAEDLTGMTPLPPSIDPATIPLSFDFRCIKKETDANKIKFPYWKFGPDFDYVHQIGGIGRCFISHVNQPAAQNKP